MACFIVPAAEAVVSTAVKKANDASAKKSHKEITNPFIKRMNWLNTMLWGGSALLAFEHVWHGEVVPWFPILTAASEGSEAVSEMLHEMATSGVAMAALVTAAWAVMVLVTNVAEKRSIKKSLNGGEA